MLLVLAGQAMLGADRHPMQVSAFYIDKTEVSVRDYIRFCNATGRRLPGTSTAEPDMPVTNVSYDDASSYATWARKRLPTAVEWEKAARGTNGLEYPWGHEFLAGYANVPKPGIPAQLMRVDALPQGASPYGALNMLGNVWEWVNTNVPAPSEEGFLLYRREFKDLNPPLSADDAFYQIRGGSYKRKAHATSYSELLWQDVPFPARAQTDDVGFRCAKDTITADARGKP
jgi:formylglycine-generating enzyme required for sulfatase activity